MRRRVAAALFVLALAGCAGGDDEPEAEAPSVRARTAVEPAGPGDALGSFAAAASSADAGAMWALLSRASRARLGPHLSDFRTRADEIGRAAGRAGGRGAEPILAERINARWAVAAIARELPSGHAAYAAALRLEDGSWRVEVADPLRIRPILPDPDERLAKVRTQIAAEFKAPDPITEAGLWLDGRAVPTTAGGLGPTYFTAFGESGRLQPGVHSVVAFASTPRAARALAWTFVIRAAGDA